MLMVIIATLGRGQTIRAPGCRSKAMRDSERRPALGADGREEELPLDEKAIYTCYRPTETRGAGYD